MDHLERDVLKAGELAQMVEPHRRARSRSVYRPAARSRCRPRPSITKYQVTNHQFMKAVLDHIGIAVKDLSAALAFYRDALGLEVEAARGSDEPAGARAFRPGRRVEARAARGHGIGIGDRQVSSTSAVPASTTSRCGSTTSTRRSPSPVARRPDDRRTAAARGGGPDDRLRPSLLGARCAHRAQATRRSPTHPPPAIRHRPSRDSLWRASS